MIDVKQAIKIANEYFAYIYPDQPFSDVLLEEVELDDEKNSWLITIGFTIPRSEQEGSTFQNMLGLKSGGWRRYKVFEIHIETGKVLSMKIRTVEHA